VAGHSACAGPTRNKGQPDWTASGATSSQNSGAGISGAPGNKAHLRVRHGRVNSSVQQQEHVCKSRGGLPREGQSPVCRRLRRRGRCPVPDHPAFSYFPNPYTSPQAKGFGMFLREGSRWMLNPITADDARLAGRRMGRCGPQERNDDNASSFKGATNAKRWNRSRQRASVAWSLTIDWMRSTTSSSASTKLRMEIAET
jgi:hypothetical protein